MRKSLRKLLLMAAVLLVPWVTQAQEVQDYNFITGEDSTMWITLSSSATHISDIEGEDDYGSDCINIGFTFNYAGTSYTQFSCNSNGRMRLGSTAVSNRWNLPFTTLTDASYNDLPLITAFGMDNTLGGTGAYCKYELTGTAPNRILVIEYSTPSEYDEEGDLVSYQIQLLEDSSKIRFVYGSTSATYFDDYQIGLAASATDYLMIDASSNSPVSNTAFTNDDWPGEYRYYEFTPFVPTCPRTTELTFFNIANDTASVMFGEQGTATSWMLEYADSMFVPGAGQGNLVNLTDTFYQFTGLLPQTTYYVYVHADCGGGDTSLNRFGSFRTPCTVYPHDSLPYRQGFEGWVTGSTGADDEWVPGDP